MYQKMEGKTTIELLKKFYALKEQHKLTALSEMNTSAERNSDV